MVYEGKKGVKDDASVFGQSDSRLELPFTELKKSGYRSTFGIMSPLGWERTVVIGLVPSLSKLNIPAFGKP